MKRKLAKILLFLLVVMVVACHQDVLKFYISNLNQELDIYNATPLMSAIWFKDIDKITSLIKSGVNLQEKRSYRMGSRRGQADAMEEAWITGNHEVVELLHNAGGPYPIEAFGIKLQQ